MSANYTTSYFHAESPILSKLSSSTSIRQFEDTLGFRVDMASLHDALVHAYDRVIAEDQILNRTSQDIERRVILQTLSILHSRQVTGQLYAAANIRDTHDRLPYTPRAIPTSVAQHKESVPSVVPRPANTLGINTRNAFTPICNRSLTPHQLRQMRGLATSALSENILTPRPTQ